MNDRLVAADARIRSRPELSHAVSLLVAHRGETVFERYYRGTGPDDLSHIHSVTKSVVSTLVGILAGEGALPLDTPVASLVAAPAFESCPEKRAITVRHLLTMTSGLDRSGRWDIAELDRSGGPLVERILDAPLVTEPGRSFAYSNGASHVLSAVIEAAAGRPAADFAAERLFAPLDVRRWEWPADPQGHHMGCGGLRLTPVDLLKIGMLYLGGGRFHGVRLVAEAYVRTATSPLTVGGLPERCSYGLLWWVAERAARPMYFAGGYGGQFVVVVPDLDLVVVTLTDTEAVDRPLGMPLRNVITELVVPAFSG